MEDKHPPPADLTAPATVDLTGTSNVQVMAAAEGWTAESYAWALAETIRSTEVPLDRSRERLAALATAGACADRAAASELALHYQLLEALFHRFSLEASRTLDRPSPGSADRAHTLLSAGLKAQRAALACLSAMRVLRDGSGTSRGHQQTIPAPTTSMNPSECL